MNRLILAGALSLVGGFASATVLTFDLVTGGVINVSDLPTYGDRVTATTMGSYTYGSTFGFTPNVVVDYTARGTGVSMGTWGTGYGDLVNNIWGSGGSSGENVGIVTLTADPGWFVTLRDLDVARWSTGAGIPPNFLRIYDSGNNLMFEHTTEFFGTGTGGHNDFSWANGLTSSVITIEFSQGWWTGVDNIGFGQTNVIPEPATFAVLGLGTLALRRRRK